MPVPPVVIRMRARRPRPARSIQHRTSAGSSRTIVLPVTTWPGRLEQRHDRRAARVGGLGAGVADGEHGAADGRRRLGAVFGVAHAESARADSLFAALARFAAALAGLGRCRHPRGPAAKPTRRRAPASIAPRERWVTQTLAAMTVDEKVGQLLMAQVASTYIGTDSDEFDRVSAFVRDQHVGGFILFGGSEPRRTSCSTPPTAR